MTGGMSWQNVSQVSGVKIDFFDSATLKETWIAVAHHIYLNLEISALCLANLSLSHGGHDIRHRLKC